MSIAKIVWQLPEAVVVKMLLFQSSGGGSFWKKVMGCPFSPPAGMEKHLRESLNILEQREVSQKNWVHCSFG